jgi:hypothetical protein
VIDNADPIDPSVTIAGGQYRYETLASAVALSSGTTYTLAWQVGSADLSASDSLVISYASLVVHPDVAIANQSRFLSTSSFTFPTNSGTADFLFRGNVNAQIEATAVPEPASLTLLGLGVAGLLGYRLRRRAA